MSDTEIQRLRIKIIKGISISSHKLMDEKIRYHNSIAIMKDDQVTVIPPDKIQDFPIK